MDLLGGRERLCKMDLLGGEGDCVRWTCLVGREIV